jgi:hypothetical protein
MAGSILIILTGSINCVGEGSGEIQDAGIPENNSYELQDCRLGKKETELGNLFPSLILIAKIKAPGIKPLRRFQSQLFFLHEVLGKSYKYQDQYYA